MKPTLEPAGRTGLPWTPTEDAYLHAFAATTDVREMARVIRRTRQDVGVRIVTLGLHGQVATRKAELVTRRRAIAEAASGVAPADPQVTIDDAALRSGGVAWTAEEDARVLAAEVITEELAASLRRDLSAVILRRERLQRKAGTPKRKPSRWTADEDALLATHDDCAVAVATGRTLNSVRTRRKHLQEPRLEEAA